MRRINITAALAACSAITVAAPAAAHVTANPAEGPSDGYVTVGFQVPHGCDGAGTRRLRVQIPPSVPSVTPGVHPGWTTTTKEAKKDKVKLHGETITKGVGEIIWTAKEAGPLPDKRLDVFQASLKLPKGKEGEEIYFPTVQECEKGSTRWVQIPKPGQSEDDLEEPAPAVALTAAEGGHDAKEEKVNAQPAAAVTSGGDDDGPSTGLVIAALAVGALGLLVGTAGLLTARRRPA